MVSLNKYVVHINKIGIIKKIMNNFQFYFFSK